MSNLKHGYSHRYNRHPLYNIWRSMKYRCYNKNNIDYKNYGKRGISVCTEWLNNPEVFIKWGLINGYKEGLQIDRINNNGNYEPLNCRFTTNKINCQNRRSTKLTQDQVNEIRYLYKNFSILQKELVLLYNSTRGTINDIIKNRTWK